jgi:hypothetical protein
LAAQGNYTEADTYFEQALQVFRECELRLDYARALYGYGVTLLEREPCEEVQPNTGLTYLHEARAIFANTHAAIDLELVDHTLASYRPAKVGASLNYSPE